VTSGMSQDEGGVSERKTQMIEYDTKGTSVNISTVTLEQATGS